MTQSSSDIIVFYLNDTLYNELSLVISGFRAIANHFDNELYYRPNRQKDEL